MMRRNAPTTSGRPLAPVAMFTISCIFVSCTTPTTERPSRPTGSSDGAPAGDPSGADAAPGDILAIGDSASGDAFIGSPGDAAGPVDVCGPGLHLPSGTELVVDLTWDTTRDLDAHLTSLAVGGNVFHQASDCYWSSCTPACESSFKGCTEWSTEARFQGPNPLLELGDSNGFGPERIRVSTLETGAYQAYVQYWGLNDPTDETTVATLSIWFDGALAIEASRTLQRDDLWQAVLIVKNPGGDVTVSSPCCEGGDTGAIRSLPYLPDHDSGYTFEC